MVLIIGLAFGIITIEELKCTNSFLDICTCTFFRITREEYVLHNTLSYNISNNNSTLSDSFTTSLFSSNFRQNCVMLYTTLIFFLIVTFTVRCVTYVLFCTIASINVHNQMFDRFIKATMFFFNTKSSGNNLTLSNLTRAGL